MTVELSEVILNVQDMNAEVNFYQQVLGLKVVEPQGAKDFREFYTVKSLPATFISHQLPKHSHTNDYPHRSMRQLHR